MLFFSFRGHSYLYGIPFAKSRSAIIIYQMTGIYNEETHTVTWRLAAVPAGKRDRVTLTVKVLPGALVSGGGPGKVVNGGETATVNINSSYNILCIHEFSAECNYISIIMLSH